MRRIIHYLMAFAIAATTFVACHKDDNEVKYVADVSVPETVPTTTEGDLLLEAGAHEFTFDIKTDGEWTVTSQNRFLHVQNAKGTGNATVTVRVENNRSDDRKFGVLDIVFPGHEELNQTLTVEQKYQGDYGGNAAGNIETSNQIYAVGYSYDATDSYANPNSVKLEVFDTQALMDDGVLAVNAAQSSLVENTITGSSVSEMSNKLSVKANVSGSYCGFKGEVKASFDMEHTSSSNYEYSITYLDLGVRKASLNKSLEALKDDYMTDDAWNDINGVPVKNKRGIGKIRYESNDEGFKKLIEAYGTHVIIRAGLGGRVRRSMEVNISKITSSYDIKAFAKASYEGVVDASVEVEDNYKQSFKDSREYVDIKSDVLGGEESLNKTLATKNGFTRSNLNAWMQSVTADNMALVSFDEGSLVPIYELVERNATDENGGFNGKTRYEKLKEYIDKKMGLDPDFANYDCGTVFEFTPPTFDNKWNTTLVKDIYSDGHWVAQVCNEYIPALNRDSRITVVYPVIVNQPRYNMGFFLGNNSHKPARVSWTSKGVNIEEYSELDFGKVSKLYLRGASIKSEPYKGMESKIATARDEYLEAVRGTSTGTYPIVKIFNMMWARESYKYMTSTHCSRDVSVTLDGKPVTITNICIYPFSATDSSIYPSGWRIASWGEYYDLLETLKANGHTTPIKALLNGGQTGFELVFEGWNHESGYTWRTDFQLIGTRDPVFFKIDNNNTYECIGWETHRAPVRVNKSLF